MTDTDGMSNIAEDKQRMEIAKKAFQEVLKQYLVGGNPMYRSDGKQNELELRFGTNTYSGRIMTKMNYDNVVKELFQNGFTTENENGTQMLRINYQDSLTDDRKMANIRAEINGKDLIEEYCKTNSLRKIEELPSSNLNKLNFTRKSSTKDGQGNWNKPVDMLDWNFRVSHSLEQAFNPNVPFVKSSIDTWNDRKKTFRLMNRVRFTHDIYPVFADISIVRSSKKYARKGGSNTPVPTYTIQESGVFDNVETYEIELEVDNSNVGNGTLYDTPEKLMEMLRKCIRIVLSGIQQCFYPIPFSERDMVLNGYMKIVTGKDDYVYKKIKINDKRDFSTNFQFVGPGSITLQRNHILENKNTIHTNVLKNYTVTDKADGERKLLYIHTDGRIYLIDNNFNVLFSGMKTTETTICNSILDGELIKKDKYGNVINMYAAFDIYYIQGKNVRNKPFYPDIEGELPNNYRLPLLQQIVDLLKPSSIVGEKQILNWKQRKNEKGDIYWVESNTMKISKTKPKMEHSCKLIVQCKQFEIVSEEKSVFVCCSNILKNVADGLFNYETDGLIFTPTNMSVGGMETGQESPINSATWEMSFKWKPADQNTIDFLVTVKKDNTGKDEIQHIFQEGLNLTGTQQIEQYKTLELMCGYNEQTDGYVNPYQDMIQDNFSHTSYEKVSNQNYKAELFVPTDPYDINAYTCKIKLHDDSNELYMMSEEGEYFEEFNIVEFRYDATLPPNMRWIPLRVRHDKTQKLKNGEKQYGNAYRVANSNWYSIHYPVSYDMITTGQNIPDVVEEGVYYKTSNTNNTQGLRDFHNLYVKKKLIMGVSNAKDTLIDYAVGMAGDLPKWTTAKLSYIFGIDISHQNIHNKKRGACSRYLNLQKENPSSPKALFIVGDSSLNIRDTNAFTSKDKQIANAVFGKGTKDPAIIGKGTVSRYGIGEQGFNISSCQFSIHYFFENPIKLHGFLRNVSECTKINGYFIGTGYDGKSIFKMLSKKHDGESSVFMTDRNGKRVKICEIIKRYNDTGFQDDETSLGYAIDVYQESINNTMREFLVNFSYLTEVISNYGFVLITNEEARQMGFPNNSGLFDELYETMKNEIQQNHKQKNYYKEAPYMSSIERSLSFLNRYFIFKKTTNVDASKIEKMFLKGVSIETIDPEEIEEFQNTFKKQKPVRGEIKKTKMRTKLHKAPSDILSEQSDFQIE
jgi:hypothetical protein